MNSTDLQSKWNSSNSLLVIDPKGDFRHIPDELGRDRWRIFSIHDGFRIGTTPPWPCKDPTSFLNQYAKLLCAECDLKFSQSVLLKAMYFLLACLNPKGGDLVRWPTPFQILELLDATSDTAFSRKTQYVMALKQQLDFIIANSGQLFNATQGGFNVFDHLVNPGYSAVIDLSNAAPKIVAIIVNLIASQLLHLVLGHRLMVDRICFVYIIDEADPLVADFAGAKYPEQYSPLGLLFKQSREFGLQVIVSSSTAIMDRIITANITSHFFFNQSDPLSIRNACNTLLSPDSGQLLTSLKPGECIFKESQGPVTYPMLAKIDYAAPSRETRPLQFDHLSYTPGQSIHEIPAVLEAIDNLKEERRDARIKKARKKTGGLPDNARKLLDLISLHPVTPTSKLWHHIGMFSPTAKKAMMDNLENQSLARFTQVRVGKMNLFLPEITEEGWQYLGKTAPTGYGAGTIQHVFGIQVVKRIGEKRGLTAHTEYPIPPSGHRVDCAWVMPDGRIQAFEIVWTCDSNLPSHLTSCLACEALDAITVVAFTKEKLKNVNTILKQASDIDPNDERVKFASLDIFVKELWP